MSLHRGRALALAGLTVAAVAATATKIRSNDLWWHLAAGRWMLDNGSIPRADPFSFTSGGLPWVDHGWLWQLAAILIERAGGVGAVAILKIASAVTFVLAAWWALRRAEWGAHAACALIAVCLAGARFRFADRPEAAALALLATFLAVLVARGLHPGRRLAAAAAISIVWANVHASALLAPALAAAAAAGCLVACALAVAGRRGASPDLLGRARDHALVAVASGAGLLANPWGYGLLLVPFRLRSVLAMGGFVNPEWPPPPPGSFPLFWLSAVAVLAVAAIRVSRRVSPRTWEGLMLVGSAAWLAFGSIRHVGLFFVSLPFAAAAAVVGPARLAPGPEGGKGSARRGAGGLLPAGWSWVWGALAAAWFFFAPAIPVGPPGFGVEAGRFPEGETDWIEAHLAPPRGLYNDVAHGGYLEWRLYPGDRAFIDGRNEVHAGLLAESAAAVGDGRLWQEMLDRHAIDAALVRYRPGRIAVDAPGGLRRSFAPLHFPRSRWALVHWGDAGMVFLRRDGRHGDLAAREEYRAVEPEDWEHLLERVEREGDLLRQAVLADIRRRLVEEPHSRRAGDLLRAFMEEGAP
jgi:hypothetical protein